MMKFLESLIEKSESKQATKPNTVGCTKCSNQETKGQSVYVSVQGCYQSWVHSFLFEKERDGGVLFAKICSFFALASRKLPFSYKALYWNAIRSNINDLLPTNYGDCPVPIRSDSEIGMQWFFYKQALGIGNKWTLRMCGCALHSNDLIFLRQTSQSFSIDWIYGLFGCGLSARLCRRFRKRNNLPAISGKERIYIKWFPNSGIHFLTYTKSSKGRTALLVHQNNSIWVDQSI